VEGPSTINSILYHSFEIIKFDTASTDAEPIGEVREFSAFTADLEAMKEWLPQALSKLLQMGGMVESAIHLAVRSLIEQNRNLAEEVIREEPKVDRLEMEIDGLATRLLALKHYQMRKESMPKPAGRHGHESTSMEDQYTMIDDEALDDARRKMNAFQTERGLLPSSEDGRTISSLKAKIQRLGGTVWMAVMG
jgi:hypothetical protein